MQKVFKISLSFLLAALSICSTSALAMVGPTIAVQPTSSTVSAGVDVQFTVSVSGTAPLVYQWRFNQSELLGATNGSLLLSNVQSNHAGGYDVVITDADNTIASEVATLTVLPAAPIIITQSLSRVVSVGQDIAFAVAAKGTELITCQWQKDETNLPGANSLTLTLNSVNASFNGTYRAALTNSVGYAYSTNMTLVVSPVVMWGVSTQRYLGTNMIPAGATNVAVVAAGLAGDDEGSPCLVLRGDGTLVSWGCFYEPPNISNVVAISSRGPDQIHTEASLENNLALLADGSVRNWFDPDPIPEVTNANVIALEAGSHHQLALLGDGSLRAWGWFFNPIVLLESVTNVVAIAVGHVHSHALRADGTVVGWGNDTRGQLSALSNVTNVVAISAASSQSLALLADGTVRGWIVTNSNPRDIYDAIYGPPPANWTNIAAISVGLRHSLALQSNGTLLTCGFSNYGQTTVPSYLSNIVAISAGGYHSVALVRDPFAPPIPPRIGRPPVGRAVVAGRTAVFNALAVGGLPLSYQWLREGQPVIGQNRSSLVLTNVLPTDAGDYQLVAMNDSGSVTSVVAHVNVTLPHPQVTSFGVAAGKFQFTFNSVATYTYVVDYKDNLNDSAWTELERRTGSGGVETIIDPTSAPNGTAATRVYRLRVE